MLGRDKWIFTHYVRDASGNVKATYKRGYETGNGNLETFRMGEYSMYGSTRLGVKHMAGEEALLASVPYAAEIDAEGRVTGITYTGAHSVKTGSVNRQSRVLGLKGFELSNHLGNVLVVVSDRKEAQGSQPVTAYKAVVETAHNYYAFGMQMDFPGSVVGSLGYRYGFNGQEKDDEIYGDGNAYAFEYRIHDPRIGRFLSVDPVAAEYPWNSPYAFAENRVINGGDLEGREWDSKYKWTDVIKDPEHISFLKEKIGKNYTEGMTYEHAWVFLAPVLQQEALDNKKQFDCADFSFYILVQYAYTFQLPVHIEDYKKETRDPTFDNDNYGYYDKKGNWVEIKKDDWEALAKAIGGKTKGVKDGSHYGASDLYSNFSKFTEDVEQYTDLVPGDLVAVKWNIQGGGHSMTVTEIMDTDNNGVMDHFTTIQGSHRGGIPVDVHKTDPRSYDTWFEKMTNDDGTIKAVDVKVKKWNFKFFDKHF